MSHRLRIDPDTLTIALKPEFWTFVLQFLILYARCPLYTQKEGIYSALNLGLLCAIGGQIYLHKQKDRLAVVAPIGRSRYGQATADAFRFLDDIQPSPQQIFLSRANQRGLFLFARGDKGFALVRRNLFGHRSFSALLPLFFLFQPFLCRRLFLRA